jgi:outer membrane lipoprotein-sorting protein
VKKFINIIVLSLIGFQFLFSACVPTKQIAEDRVYSVDRLVKRLEGNRRKIKEFNATGNLNINSPSINAKSNFEVSIKRPDSLKISFYGPFNIDLAHAVITSRDFIFYDVINNTAYRGDMKDGILKRIMKVDMPLTDIIDALTGSVNLTDKLRTEPDQFEADNDFYKLTFIDRVNKIENSYFVRYSDLAITENIIKDFNGKILLAGKFSKFKIIDELAIPHEINLDDQQNKQKIKIDYRNVELNSNKINMKLEIPNDVKISEW